MRGNGSRRALPARQRGVGMIEVMVAVLVLAIGMLGIAALQAITLKNSDSSASRTQASMQVYSMLDIIRANRDNISIYNTNIYVEGTDGSSVGSMNAWLFGLQQTVAPDAKGLVVCTADTMVCTVGVKWSDDRATGGSAVGGEVTMTSEL